MLESCCDASNSSLYVSTVVWACRPAGRLSGGAGRPCNGQAAASRDAADKVALALAHVDERTPGHALGRGRALRVALRLPSPSCQLFLACIDSSWGMQNSSATVSPSLQLLAENRRRPVGSVSWKKVRSGATYLNPILVHFHRRFRFAQAHGYRRRDMFIHFHPPSQWWHRRMTQVADTR